jgi:hypothetical protein
MQLRAIEAAIIHRPAERTKDSTEGAMKISGKTYDVLKFIAQIGLPALGTLYFTLAGIWGLPAAEQVVGTVVAVDTFLGVILQISSANFNAETAMGIINVIQTRDGKTVSLELNGDPVEALEGKNRAVFEVNKTKKS